ncbi:hypothetical protein Tco_1075034, partial [Tanacetum coccineum]
FCRPSVFSQAVDESPHVEVTAQVEPSNDAPFTNHDIHVGTASNVRGVSSSCGKQKMHPHVDSRSWVGANRGLRRQSAQSISVDTQDEHKKRRETGLKGETKPDLTDILISILEGSCKVEFQVD